METVVLLIQCPDQRGIVARITEHVFGLGGNIVDSNQHSSGPEAGQFFMRLEFCLDAAPERAAFESGFESLAHDLGAALQLHYASDIPRMAIAVSKFDHCLIDILYRVRVGELNVAIPCVISNHETTRHIVEDHGIRFIHLPVSKETRPEQERQFLEHIKEDSDFLVLTRYMQILTEGFLDGYGRPVINIHHSFLPSFKGANPYRQAYERGVKLIGATAHYATTNLDEGPIIEQVVGRATHKDTPETLRQKGRTLEQQALARAITAHAQHRIIRYQNKTIVFD